MKKLVSLLLALICLLLLAACAMRPDDEQLDVSQPYGDQVKLLHLNGSSQEKRERIRQVYQALYDCYPIDKDPALFAYYPDYQVTVKGVDQEVIHADYQLPVPVADIFRDGQEVRAVVDINGDWVDILFTRPPGDGYRFDDDAVEGHIFRSRVSAKDFKALLNVE